jgi:hypothetical protein
MNHEEYSQHLQDHLTVLVRVLRPLTACCEASREGGGGQKVFGDEVK